MEEPDHKGPAGNPSGVGGVESGEDVAGAVASVFGNGKYANDDGNDTTKGPEDGKSLRRVSKTLMLAGGNAYIEPGQPLVTKGTHDVAKKRNTKEDQVHLPGVALEDADTGFAFEDVDTGDIKEGGSKVDRKSNGYVSNDEAPATDPRGDFAVRGRSQHEGLVVDAATGRVDTRNLAEGGSDAEDNARDGQPSPDDCYGPAVDYGVVQSRGQTVGDRRQNKRHEGDLQGRSRAHQLRLVTHGSQQVVGIIDDAALGGVAVLGKAHLPTLFCGARDKVVLSRVGVGLGAVGGLGGHGGGRWGRPGGSWGHNGVAGAEEVGEKSAMWSLEWGPGRALRAAETSGGRRPDTR